MHELPDLPASERTAHEPLADETTERAAPTAHPLAWIVVGLEAILLLALALHYGGGYFPALKGQLLPCMAFALLPGSILRILGRPSMPGHRVGIAVGLVTFMIWNGNLDLGTFLDAFTRWPLMLTGLALVFLVPLLGALRWFILMRALEMDLTYIHVLRLTLVGYFFNTFVPGGTGGDVYRVFHVARHSEDTPKAMTSVILDRFTGLPPLAILILGASFANWEFLTTHDKLSSLTWIVFGLAIFSVLLVGYLFFGSLYVLEWTRRLEDRLPGGQHLVRLCESIAKYQKHPLVLLQTVALGLVAHTFSVLACLCFARAVGIQSVSAASFFFLIPLGLAVNAVPITPGGIGVGEKAFGVLFASFDPAIAEATGAAVMLCLRVALFLVGSIGGLCYATSRPEKDSASPENPDGGPAPEGESVHASSHHPQSGADGSPRTNVED